MATRKTPGSKIGRNMPPLIPQPPDIDAVLADRGARYGAFIDHATITQALKRILVAHAVTHGKVLAPDQAEAIDMICHKLGRIVNGDPDYADSWLDVAGYAKLVADRLQGVAK